MTALEFLQLKGLKVREDRPEKSYYMKTKEVARLLDDYLGMKIGTYMKLKSQYEKTGCENCAAALKVLEEEFEKLSKRYQR